VRKIVSRWVVRTVSFQGLISVMSVRMDIYFIILTVIMHALLVVIGSKIPVLLVVKTVELAMDL
jgi:hypothetical protein